jgi:prephenate dehydrogenase
VDLCGVKQAIFGRMKDTAKQWGFTFIGGHPMAGAVTPGFRSAREKMFKGASMILVPGDCDDLPKLDRVCSLFREVGFAKIVTCTPEEHDRRIAFTSQLAHIVSNAYVKSPTAQYHKGFSAGSYKDMTRVAWLNENMWTELFLDNKQPLLYEIDTIISSLTEYRNAIEANDADTLRSLLRDGRIAKEKVDGR